jgi:LysM repeat protein
MLNTNHRWLTLSLLSVLLITTGCFRSVGDESLITAVSERVTDTATPTSSNTPLPTNTATPVDAVALAFDRPTETATDTPTATATDTATSTIATTVISSATNTPLSVAQAATSTPDDFQLTATELVRTATEGAGIPLTQTAAFLQGPSSTPTNTATATFNPFVPSNTPAVNTGAGGSGGGNVVPTGQDCVHEVRRGERLYLLSRYYGIGVSQIIARNNIVTPDIISVGQRLVIPGCGTLNRLPPATSTPRPGVTNVPGIPNPQPINCGTQYMIQDNDTLYSIAVTCGVTVAELQTVNRIVNPNLIFVGDTLIIPN